MKICEGCGSTIPESGSRNGRERKWCRDACRVRDYRTRNSVPCAGCGALLWDGAGSLPGGERRCRPCRRTPEWQAELDERKRLRQVEQVRLQRERRAAARVPHPCPTCGVSVASPHATYCPGCAQARRLAHFQRKNLVRRAGGDEPMSVAELGERDRWRCHLCRRAVDPALRHPHRMSASRDHLIPVAAGGTNDPANLALAHWICNVRRGTRGVVQLALVG